MITVKEDTTLVGISEFRTHADDILKTARKHRVVIEKRNKPVAVLLSMELYEKLEELIEAVEDRVLGEIALKRIKNYKGHLLTIDQFKKRIGLK